MTNEEMVKWAQLEQASDFVWHANKENLDALIWIAKMEGKKEIASQVTMTVRQVVDAGLLSSYPGGLLKRKKNNG